MTRQQYIDTYKDAAVYSTIGTGLFPSVQLAQGIVESGNGNSVLAQPPYNNHFGIKADQSWTGPSVNMATREVVNGADTTQGAYFRVYPNADASYADRVKFLQDNSRYTNNGVFSAPDPMSQLQALQAAGYATDPNYASIIDQVLTNNDLTVLDTILAATKKYWYVLAIGLGLMGMSIYLYKSSSK